MDATYIDQLFDTLLDVFGEKIKVTFNQDEKEKVRLGIDLGATCSFINCVHRLLKMAYCDCKIIVLF